MLHVCYSPFYFAVTHTNSMEKLCAVAAKLKDLYSKNICFHEPEILDPQILYELHDTKYVDAFFTGDPPKLATMAGFKPWNTQLRDAVLRINSGQLLATELAFKYGISANIAQGFHHATYEYGGSFCTFNGLALVAKQYPQKRIFVLDCDQHLGDGTVEFAQRLDNLFNYSIYGYPLSVTPNDRSISRLIHKKTGSFQQYAQAINDAFAKAIDWNADLIIYQAGMDCHQDDRFGSSWFSTEFIEQREKMVFELAKKHQIPVMFVLAGGYQNLPDLVELHVKTFKIANEIYYGS